MKKMQSARNAKVATLLESDKKLTIQIENMGKFVKDTKVVSLCNLTIYSHSQGLREVAPGGFEGKITDYTPYGFTVTFHNGFTSDFSFDDAEKFLCIRTITPADANKEALKKFRVSLKKQDAKMNTLLKNIKKNMPELEKLKNDINDHWTYEDLIYRFYHQSFKVYYVQSVTIRCVDFLKKIAPKDIVFNSFLEKIISEGTGKTFKMSHNDNWLKHTRPMIEAYLHVKYFVEMAFRYGNELEKAPHCLPSGWASLLYAYNLR